MIASRYPGHNTGFTLIEMMVVLTLISLMLTASIAAVDQFLKDTGSQSALRIVRGALFASKMKAIRERRRVQFDVRSMGTLVTFEPGTGSGGTTWYRSGGPSWRTNTFQSMYLQARPEADSGGDGVTMGDVARITSNDANKVTVEHSITLGDPPVLDIVQEAGMQQMSVTPDRKSEQWKLLPRFMFVNVHEDKSFSSTSLLPITFKPDGSLDIKPYKIVVDIMDTRGEIGDETRTLHLYRNTGAIREITEEDK